MFTVSECDLISNTLTSHDSAPIRGRPTLKNVERFRTGSIIHKYTINSGDSQKCYTKSCQKCDKNITEIKSTTAIKSITEMTNNTQTNIQKTNLNSQSSCCTVNEHKVNMAASRKATKYMDNAISFEQTTIKNFSTILSKEHGWSKNFAI